MEILIIKTGAMGDVLRTTSILPGLAKLHPEARITWLTAKGSEDLLRARPELVRIISVDLEKPGDLKRVGQELGGMAWDRVLSFDDERVMCELASELAGDPSIISGALVRADGSLGYSPDTEPWFGMGLLSEHGKEEADRRKLCNRESHPAIFAHMLGLEQARASLDIGEGAQRFAAEFARQHGLHDMPPLIGLNTGAGGRWVSKRLPVERSVALVEELHRRLAPAQPPSFLLLGGPREAERNQAIRAGLGREIHCLDAGSNHSILNFAGLIGQLDLMITSDSLGLHLAVAARVPVVAFFAPTSPAEIEIYGLGEKVVSESPDAGSYRPDVDISSLTVERLADASMRVLAACASAAESARRRGT